MCAQTQVAAAAVPEVRASMLLVLLVSILLACGLCNAKLYDPDTWARLKSRPRAIVVYVSGQDWALVEFLTMLHASWRYTLMLPGAEDYKLDLIVLSDDRYFIDLTAFCENITPVLQSTEQYATQDSPLDPHKSQCFLGLSFGAPHKQWHGYPFINNVYPLTQEPVVSFLTDNYGYVMKTDCDTLITPTFLHYFPEMFMFGIQEYVLLDETATRLQQVSATLKLPGPVRHNLGPTWYGDASEIIALAQASVPPMHHIVTKEFEQKPGGGIKQAWSQGEGWPQWSAGMAALYATSLVAAHTLDTYDTTPYMDAHTDSDGLIAGFIHLHSRHGDSNFSKFEMFQNKYTEVDLSRVDVATARGFSLFVAVSTWRQLMTTTHGAGTAKDTTSTATGDPRQAAQTSQASQASQGEQASQASGPENVKPMFRDGSLTSIQEDTDGYDDTYEEW